MKLPSYHVTIIVCLMRTRMLTDVVVVKLNLKNCLDASRFSAFDGGRVVCCQL